MQEYDDIKGDHFVLICKPEQSGKTFVMLQQIIKDLEEPSGDKEVINFILCDNSLLLTRQTSSRIDSELTPFSINGETYIEFSSSVNGKACKDYNAVIAKITCDDIRNVICCTNKPRVKDIEKIIESLNRSKMFHDKFIFKIWLDEADKYLTFIYNAFKPVIETLDNVYLYCLTATPKTQFDKYKYMNVFPLEQTITETYHGWEDNNRVILENSTGTAIGFIHEVISSHPENVLPGTKWYIPGENKKSSHEIIRDMLVGKGLAVFIVNGDGISLTIPDRAFKKIHQDKTDELNKQIIKMYNEYNLEQYPVAITGYICIGRGITIMSEEFIFDYGILSNCNKKAEASQNAGRLKGNIKSWSNYKPPTVYTTHKFDEIASEWEWKSRNLAKIAFEKDTEQPSKITKSEFKKITSSNEDDKWDLIMDEFDTLREANILLKKHGFNKRNDTKYKEDDNGFITSSLTQEKEILKYEDVKLAMENWSKIANLDVKGNKKKGSRIYICYKDLLDNKSIVYIVRIALKK